MSITDPLSDMITRLRNSQAAGKTSVTMPSSKLKLSLCKVLKDEGYIEEYSVCSQREKKTLMVSLKYYKGEPVIESIQRVSKPGCRCYRSKSSLPQVLGGLGISIISTSKGLMSDKSAKAQGYGGEVVCIVY